MKPKGEEGEFYMKKSLLVLASIMILALCIFVACTAEVTDPYDGLTYVTFGGEAPASRNLNASYKVKPYNELYWFYTAEKLDNYGTSGATTSATAVVKDDTGLNGSVGPFSQGKWKFTLSAYTSNAGNEENKVYEGSVEVSLKGQKVTVPVSVTPCGKTGALAFSGAYFAWKDNGDRATAIPTITIVAEGTTTGQKYTLSNSFTTEFDNTNAKDVKIRLNFSNKDSDGRFYIVNKNGEKTVEFGSVVADYYNSTIIAYIDVEGSQTPVLTQSLGFRVYGSAKTVISGDITEGQFTDVDFSIDNMAISDISDENSTMSFSVTPSGVEGNKTTVDFSDAGLEGRHVLVVDVDSVVEASSFKLEGFDSTGKSIVAGIGLELSSVGETSQTPVTNFGDGKSVKVTTYIVKGLSNVTVKYNGANGNDPTGTDVKYNSETGELSFITTHFSEFYVVADKVEAINFNKNEVSKLLTDSISECNDGDTIVLLSDASVYKVEIATPISESPKNINIDLNGHSITGMAGDVSPVFTITNANVHFIGKGSICGSEQYKTKGIVFLDSWGSVEVDSGISLSGYSYGILIDKYRGYGNSVRFYGSLEILDDYGIGIAVNGENKNTSDSAPAFNLDGAKINAPKGVGIYAAGYANWNISGDTEITGYNSAIEIRAGKMTIDGGTFTAKATEYSCIANGNGTTTTGAAIAVAQHNTKLPISVEIKGTPTFNGIYDLSVTNPQGNNKDAISGETGVNVTINGEVKNLYVSTDFILDRNVIRAKTTEEDSKYVACLSDGRNFTTLKSAVDAVTDSGYITLLKDTTGSEVILIEDGAKNITIDLNGNNYSVNKKNAFKFGKGNKVALKNGTVKSIYGFNAPSILIENYCDLTLDSVYLDCSSVNYPAAGVLFCGYGKTIITGDTRISNKVEERDSEGNPAKYVCKYSNMALSICNSFAYSYKEGVYVTFDENFTGKVTGYVNFELDKTNDYDGTEYKHSLIVGGNGDFSTARFCFSRVGGKSIFTMNGTPMLYIADEADKYDKFPTTTNDAGVTTLDFAKAVVHNTATDAIYEEFGRAVNDSSNGQVLELQKDFDVQSSNATDFNKESITIDLNGKRLGVDDSVSKEVLTIASGRLTIEDSSNDSGLLNKPIESFFKVSGGKLVINGGTFNSDPAAYVDTNTHDINKSAGTWTVTAKN